MNRLVKFYLGRCVLPERVDEDELLPLEVDSSPASPARVVDELCRNDDWRRNPCAVGLKRSAGSLKRGDGLRLSRGLMLVLRN